MRFSPSRVHLPGTMLAFVVAAASVLSFLAVPVLSQTQAFTASFAGTVHDQSGGAVAGAKVTVSSLDKGITRTFTTDSEGRYTFQLLPPGNYSLLVEATGFSAYREQGIDLAAGQAASENISLQVGQVQTAVTVTGEQAPLLATDNANVSSDLNERQIQQLPVNLRNVFGLVLLNSP